MLVNIHQTKTNLSKLLVKVQTSKEEIIIGKMGKPIAKLVPYNPPKNLKPGILKGKISISPDFDTTDKQIEDLFYA